MIHLSDADMKTVQRPDADAEGSERGMTMQRNDYERVSAGLRAARDATLLALHSPTEANLNGTEAVEYAEDVVKRTYRDAVTALAHSFHQVNPRFKIVKFLNDALGEDEAGHAFAERQTRMQGAP